MFQTMIHKQREFFQTGITKSYAFRKNQLEILEEMIRAHEQAILEAVKLDLGKSEYEAYITELSLTYEEIHIAKRHLKQWMKPKRVRTSLTTLFGTSYIYNEPYGTVCIISPWNYPVQLSFVPMISAIAAGNTIVLKVSSTSKHTANLLTSIINQTFDSSYIYATDASTDDAGMLISNKFDYIFFTGSTQIGQLVMKEAATHLTPVTLELGGKSPCLVLSDANIALAAKRIVLGKIINTGQTCVAPDYILVDSSIKEQFVSALWNAYLSCYPNSYHEVSYPKIIDAKQFHRLTNMLQDQTILHGGMSDPKTLKMELTILDEPSLASQAMKEEIFGPILPIISFKTSNEVLSIIKSMEKPLACYIFTQDKLEEQRWIQEISFGGGAINDCIMHLTNPNLPFGGVGASGMGSYHAKFGYDTFTHQKSILKSSKWFDLPLKYPPFHKRNIKTIKRIMK